MNRQAQGFTLIELMVTVAVLAIVAMMAMPSFSSFADNYRLNQGAESLSSALKEGRSRAAALRSPVIVCPNKNASNAVVTVDACLTAASITGADATKYKDANRVIVTDISKASISATSLFTRFSPTGTVATANTISLCVSGKGWDVVVDRLGTVSKTKKGSC